MIVTIIEIAAIGWLFWEFHKVWRQYSNFMKQEGPRRNINIKKSEITELTRLKEKLPSSMQEEASFKIKLREEEVAAMEKLQKAKDISDAVVKLRRY